MSTHAARIAVPDDLDFADLNLQRRPTGGVSFDWRPIETLCAANGLDIADFRDSDEGNVGGLIVAWYIAHRQHGGAPDPTAEDLLAEAIAEDAAGSLSHPPGRA